MNIIQSFAQFNSGHIKGKNKNMKLNFYTFLLSYLTLKKYYGSVTMYCNKKAYDTFIKYIPYDRIIIKENKYTENFWSAYKLDVIEEQTEDFIHVDSDVFIFNDLFKPFINNPEKYDIIIQNVYSDLDQKLIQLDLFDNICPNYLYDNRGFGCGVIGMRQNIKNTYIKNTKYVYDLIKNGMILGDRLHHGFVLEELTLYFTALANNFTWYDIIPFNDIINIGIKKSGNKHNYTHLWNESKFDPKIIDLIKNKIKTEFTDYYNYIIEFESNSLKNKNLVYYNVGFNESYNKLLQLSLISLRKYYDGDVLIITDYNNSKLLKTNPIFKNVKFMICEVPDIFYSALNKTKIYEYENFFDYDTILYLDCDTIIINNIDTIFETTIKNNKIGICEENETIIQGNRKYYYNKKEFNHSIYLDLYGCEFFNNIELKKYGNNYGLNSGVFCLPATEKSQKIFNNIFDNAINDYNMGKYYFLDQPYICYHLMKNEYYYILKNCYLAGYKNSTGYVNPDDILDINNKYNIDKFSIVHFITDIGNSETKYKRMLKSFPRKFIDNILNPVSTIKYKNDDNYINKENIKLVTITWSYDDKFDIENTFLYKSFIKYNSKSDFINIHFNRNDYINLEEEFFNNYGDRSEYILYKIVLAKNEIKNINADYIIYADATDTICLGNIKNIKIPNYILFSSEINKYPDTKYSKFYDDEWNKDYSTNDKSNKNYLNSGLYISPKKDYIDLSNNIIRNILPKKYKSFEGDQGVYTYHYLCNNSPQIKLDNNYDIFFNSTLREYLNYIYYDFPIFIHDPSWKYDGSRFIEKFNLDKND